MFRNIMRLIFLFLFLAALLTVCTRADEHDRAYWEHIVAQIHPGMKRSEVEKLVPAHSSMGIDHEWDYAVADYKLERHLALHIVYYQRFRDGKRTQPDSGNIVIREPKLYDPSPGVV